VFDVGLARGPWGEQFFFEGAGGGLLADYVRAAKLAGRKISSQARFLANFTLGHFIPSPPVQL
jgi:hypothetical protein